MQEAETAHKDVPQERNRVECPECGYLMPIEYDESASCHGVFVRCKGRGCGCIFEIIIADK